MAFLSEAAKRGKWDYFHFRERFGGISAARTGGGKRLRAVKTMLRVLRNTVIDMIKMLIILRRRDYQSIVVIDCFPFSVVSAIAGHRRVVLWSHDIIGTDHPAYAGWPNRLYRKLTRRALKKNGRVIVQDQDRLSLLIRSMDVEALPLRTVFMPVVLPAVDDRPMPRRITSRLPILMQLGGIGAYRLSDDLLHQYQESGGRYKLMFHGYLFPEISEQLARCAEIPLISTHLVQSNLLYQIIDFCDIGFLGYRETDMNHVYIRNASGQLVEFLRRGIPVVVAGKNNLGSFVETMQIGVAIDSVEDVGTAIGKIMSNYQQYSTACLACFRNHFDLAKYASSVFTWLNSDKTDERSDCRVA